MKIMKLLLMIGLLALGSASTDTFRFTQCECPSFEFSSDQKNNFPNPLVKVGDPGLFSCPGNGTFPEESGLIFNLADTTGSLTTTMKTNLLQDIDGRHSASWKAAFKISFTPVDGADFNLTKMLYSDNTVFELRFQINADEAIFFPPRTGGNRMSIKLSPGIENTIDFVVGEAKSIEPGVGPGFFRFNFGCFFVNGNVVNRCAVGTSDPRPSSSSVRMDLFKPNPGSKAMPIKLRMAQFDGAPVIMSKTVTFEQYFNQLNGLATRFVVQMPKVVSLPVRDVPASFTTNEDTDLAIDIDDILKGGDLSSAELSFDIRNDTKNGVITPVSSSTVSYSPNKDYHGKDLFNFTYSITSPFECSNSVSSEITIVSVDDPPIAQNIEVDVFATFGREISAEVATDVDGKEGKMEGTLTFDNSSSGVISETCDSNTPITELAVVNGSVSFCYTPDGTMILGASEFLDFTVADESNLKDTGKFVIRHKNPFLLPDEAPIEITNERTPIAFSLGKDRFGLKPVGLPEDVELGIRVVKVVEDVLGRMTDSEGKEVDSIVNSDFLPSDVLTFKPVDGLFNLVNGSPLDAAGSEVHSCNRTIEFNGGRVCAFSFEHKLFVGEIESDVAEAFFIINAIDDGNPRIRIKGKQSVDLNSLKISDVVITSDGGDNAFPVKLKISTAEVIDFIVLPPSNAQGFSSSSGSNRDVSVEDCTRKACTSVDLIGLPSQLELVANNLLLSRLPRDGVPSMKFEVVSSAEEFGNGDRMDISFNEETEEDNGFAQLSVAFIGVGMFCLVIIGFYLAMRTGPRVTGELQIETQVKTIESRA